MSEPIAMLPLNFFPDPPLEWMHGESDLNEGLQSFKMRINTHLEAQLGEIEQRVYIPFYNALKTIHQAHEKAIHTAGLDVINEDSTLVVGEALWKSLNTYRDITEKQVIAPLRRQLETLDIGYCMGEIWRQYWTTLLRFGLQLPEEILRPEPVGLYAPIPGEHLSRRTRKAMIRGYRSAALSWLRFTNRLRKIIKSPGAYAPVRSQRVPARLLASYHVNNRLSKPLANLHEKTLQHISAPIAQLEKALSTWTHEILQAEWKLDQPDYHIPHLPSSLVSKKEDFAEETATAMEAMNAVRSLRGLLEGYSGGGNLETVRAGLDALLQKTWQELETDVHEMGSFMLSADDRPIEEALPGPDARTIKRFEDWAEWHRKTADRLELLQKQIELAVNLEAIEEKLIKELSEKVIQPAIVSSEKTTSALQSLQKEAAPLFKKKKGPGLAAAINTILEKVLAALNTHYVKPLVQNRPANAARQIALQCARDIIELISQLPENMVVTALQRQESNVIEPQLVHRAVPLRRIAEQSLDALLIERFQNAITPLNKAIAEVESEAVNISSILRFNLEAAIAELTEKSETAPANKEKQATPVHAAEELTIGGLQRSADVLDHIKPNLYLALLEAAHIAGGVCAKGWIEFHERISLESKMQEQLADTLSRFREESRDVLTTTKTLAEKWWRQLLKTFRIAQSRTAELVRLGQTALGVADSTAFEARETIDALIEMDTLFAELPLVYKRLFSFRPVTDSALLIGRKADLEKARKHLAQWKKGRTDTLLLIGQYGSGLTSFLNVLKSDVLRDIQTHTIEITERWSTEDEFAKSVAEVLALDIVSPALNDIRDVLLKQPVPETPVVIAVEHLEHLLLRKVGGTNLVERVLTFMSRTDSRILWIVSVTDYGWQLIEKTEASAASLVSRHQMNTLDRSAIETLILNRHRRSGIPLVFESPADPPPLLRRKLQNASSEEGKQALLQANYFDRLTQISGQNVMLALFYWLRSIHLNEEKQLIQVNPPRTLSFEFLSEFGLNHAFSLKAFLEHGSLTLPEHSEIFMMAIEESLEIFEALGNRLLIHPVNTQNPSSVIKFSTIDENTRYRIQPLLVHPVTQYLRGKNIAY